MEIKDYIGKNVTIMLKLYGMSCAEFGDKLGLSYPYVNNIIHGKTNCSVENLIKISDCLNINLESLVTEDLQEKILEYLKPHMKDQKKLI